SGSTGQPKGVMAEHRGLVNRLEWMWKQYQFTEEDIILQKTTFTFDVSVWEIFMPLCWGAKMVLCHKDDVASPDRILSLIKNEKISCLHFVPGMLNSFMGSQFDEKGIATDLSSLRCVMTSGEALSLETVKKWYGRSGIPIHNLYGPTEASVDVSFYETSAVDTKIPIGRPIWNTQLYIVDEQNNLMPIGVMGEICIGGDGLARGYLNKPQLTAEKFVANPFSPGSKMYKTGDYGRWLPDGNIEYLGRKDHQVKIRGYRIELGEIESVIRGYDGVTAAVVTAQDRSGAERELMAYVVSKEALQKAALRTYLQERLPVYMVPSYIVELQALPLTANGKLERKRLPQLSGDDIVSSKKYVAPATGTEEKLAEIWSVVLGLPKEKISAKDNFFELGGHSLKATRLASRISREFKVKIELRELFLRADIEQQALLVEQEIKREFSSIATVPPSESYPLSASQRRLWVLSQFEAANIAYNIQGANSFKGDLDIDLLQKAFDTLVERHEILRTVIKPDQEGGGRQFILQPGALDFRISRHDLRSKAGQERDLKVWVEKDFSTPFDLAKGPLLRASLYRLSDDEWIFSYVIHHIISDGQSMEILIKELLTIYNAYSNGKENPLPPLRIQYKDYAVWQLDQLSAQKLEDHKSYWLKQFEGELPVLELQSDRLRPARKTYNGASFTTTLNATISNHVKELAKANESTLFMALMAGVKALLYRYTSHEDIIIGTPIAGREHADLEDQVGFYTNTLALRTTFSGNDSYTELLAKVKEVALGAYEHQVYPFDELVNELHLQRDVSRHPLFDMQVIVQNAESNNDENSRSLGRLDVTHFTQAKSYTSVFDMVFLFIERENGFQLVIMYNTDVYTAQQVEILSVHIEQMLAAIVQHPHRPIAELEFLSENEQQQLLYGFNNTAFALPSIETLHASFEAQAARIPDAVALVFEQTVLTYKEFNDKANQLANHLVINYDVKPGMLVGIMLDKSDKMMIAMMGILKAGAAYVPIDPEYPRARKELILKDAAIKILITSVNYFLDLDYFEGSMILDAQFDTLTESTDKCETLVRASDLAYVIYTSGSTGTPKGVMISHAAIVNSIYAQCEGFG
ncbi:MAG: amino acid adenylation domain-containing protein, partial [Chitinophagaceae bacterium]